jgi:hypothetical protein
VRVFDPGSMSFRSYELREGVTLCVEMLEFDERGVSGSKVYVPLEDVLSALKPKPKKVAHARQAP